MKSLVAYKQARNKMETGDMLEWRSNSLLGKAIRFFTKKKVNHTGMVYIAETSEGKHVFTIEAQPHGLEFNLLSHQLEEFDGEVFWSALKPEYNDKRKTGIGWVLEQINKPYDYKSLFRNIAGKVSADAQKLFCSEMYFFYLVISGMIKNMYFYNNHVYQNSTNPNDDGKMIVSPRPGEFDRFKIHESAMQIL